MHLKNQLTNSLIALKVHLQHTHTHTILSSKTVYIRLLKGTNYYLL